MLPKGTRTVNVDVTKGPITPVESHCPSYVTGGLAVDWSCEAPADAVLNELNHPSGKELDMGNACVRFTTLDDRPRRDHRRQEFIGSIRSTVRSIRSLYGRVLTLE